MAFSTLKRQVNALTFENQNLIREVSRANKRVTALESIVHLSSKNGNSYNATSNLTSHHNHDAASLWQRDTFFDTTCNRNITGNVVVVARDNATPIIISDTLGITKQITFHKAHRPIYRIAVGNKGRAEFLPYSLFYTMCGTGCRRFGKCKDNAHP